MARRQVKWALRAIKDKMAIYEYWINKNKSVVYPQIHISLTKSRNL